MSNWKWEDLDWSDDGHPLKKPKQFKYSNVRATYVPTDPSRIAVMFLPRYGKLVLCGIEKSGKINVYDELHADVEFVEGEEGITTATGSTFPSPSRIVHVTHVLILSKSNVPIQAIPLLAKPASVGSTDTVLFVAGAITLEPADAYVIVD